MYTVCGILMDIVAIVEYRGFCETDGIRTSGVNTCEICLTGGLCPAEPCHPATPAAKGAAGR
jgi:hypothetical protein